MRKIVFYTLLSSILILSVVLFSCGPSAEEIAHRQNGNKNLDSSYRSNQYNVVIIQGCEYILFTDLWGEIKQVLHKENCKYCIDFKYVRKEEE